MVICYTGLSLFLFSSWEEWYLNIKFFFYEISIHSKSWIGYAGKIETNNLILILLIIYVPCRTFRKYIIGKKYTCNVIYFRFLWKYLEKAFWDFVVIKFCCLLKIPGLPWWRSGWESACQCRGRGFEPWSGRIPHATEQLGPWATIAEPARLEPVLRNKRGRDSDRPAHRDEEWPPLAATGGSPRTETKTQHSHK